MAVVEVGPVTLVLESFLPQSLVDLKGEEIDMKLVKPSILIEVLVRIGPAATQAQSVIRG